MRCISRMLFFSFAARFPINTRNANRVLRTARHPSSFRSEFTLKFCASILRRIRVVSIQMNHCLLPLLVLEQLCLRTGAWCPALRRVSRFTGVSLTGVTGSETPLPGSLAGSGGDSMLYFKIFLELLLVYRDAPG